MPSSAETVIDFEKITETSNSDDSSELVEQLWPDNEVIVGGEKVEESIYEVDWGVLRDELPKKDYFSVPFHYPSSELSMKESGEKEWLKDVPFMPESEIAEDRLYDSTHGKVGLGDAYKHGNLSWSTYERNKALFPYVTVIQEELANLRESDTPSLQYLELLEDAILPLYEVSYESDELRTKGSSDSPRIADANEYVIPTEIRQYLLVNTAIPVLEALEEGISIDTDISEVCERLQDLASSSNGLEDMVKEAFTTQVTRTMINIGGAESVGYVLYVYDSYYNQDVFRTPEKDSPGNFRGTKEYLAESTFANYVGLLHESIIRQLSSIEDGNQVGIEAIGELLGRGSVGTLDCYVESLEKLGSHQSAGMLLSRLKSDNWLERRMSAEILFRLELGKIGVSEEGSEYLGKLYDLGKYNDPDFFVRRLNNSGLMAVLSEERGSIEGVFPLDLQHGENVVQAEVRQLISQELFLPKADETPSQRRQREEYLQLFLADYESIFSDNFFERSGIRLNSLDLHEQGWFLLTYLEHSSGDAPEDLNRLKDFVSEYGIYGLKSFLALEYGGSGQEILDFAESAELTKQEKSVIFKNFYQIANEALNWRDLFGKIEENIDYEFAPQVHEAFIRKNAEFFKAAQLIAKGEGGDVTIKDLLKNMTTITFALRSLKGLCVENSTLKLEQKPQFQNEYDVEGNLIENAVGSFVLMDEDLGARIVVSIRPQPTVKQGNISGGEARVNFSVTKLHTKERARIGFDLSDYKKLRDAGASDVLSLDLGVGKPDREEGIWPSMRVGRVLELVEGSEGGHNELSFKPEVVKHFPEIAEGFRGYMQSRFNE